MEVWPTMHWCLLQGVFDSQNIRALSAHNQLLSFSSKHSSHRIFHRFLLALYSASQSSRLPFLPTLSQSSSSFLCFFLFVLGQTLSFSWCLASFFLVKRLLDSVWSWKVVSVFGQLYKVPIFHFYLHFLKVPIAFSGSFLSYFENICFAVSFTVPCHILSSLER